MGYTIWTKHLRHNPGNPKWFNRDRFVLSAGHGSLLLYSLLHLTGYDVSLDDLKQFRQFGSKTPGHPEYGLTPGVETTTGPLGQGLGNATGMAIAETFLAAHFNRGDINIVDHYTYVIAGDGDMMEGVTSEASSLAGHLKLGKLIVLYDDNHITIEGKTDLAFSEDVLARYSAYGWHTQRVENGNDIDAISKAIDVAKNVADRPSIIAVRTHIGFGSPNKQDTAEVHGSPLGETEVELTKKNLGWPLEPKFLIPEEVLPVFRKSVECGKKSEDEWNILFEEYEKKYPELASEFRLWMSGDVPVEALRDLPRFDPAAGAVATRSASGKIINLFASKVKNFLGGAADLSPSTDTSMKETTSFSAVDRRGRNFHFGIREHGMGAILNGMAVHGGLIPFGATFLVFADYMRPPIRLAAISHFRTIYVFTHDSIGLGEDGPTHQPIEHFMSLRAIPGLIFIRPGDANETTETWKFALEYKKGPVAIALTRQKIPVIDRNKYSSETGLRHGGYVLAESGNPDAIIIATGSELGVAMKAYEDLVSRGRKVRLVSMPSWEIFDMQDEKYRESVLPANVWRRVSIEAGITKGWSRYAGERGVSIGIDRFGSSAPGEIVMKEYGITADAVAAAVEGLLK
jgi:transketolase